MTDNDYRTKCWFPTVVATVGGHKSVRAAEAYIASLDPAPDRWLIWDKDTKIVKQSE